jgi:D-alanyl-lipoteichoic acid acyltransferase DltB (MBOAT superfamily)
MHPMIALERRACGALCYGHAVYVIDMRSFHGNTLPNHNGRMTAFVAPAADRSRPHRSTSHLVYALGPTFRLTGTAMLFVSLQFVLVFLPLAVMGFFLLAYRQPEMSLALLALMSMIFFAFSGGNWPLLVLSVVINYAFGLVISHTQNENKAAATFWLVSSLIFNLGALAYYKYANWFIDNISVVFGYHIEALNVVLPVGISFFTFTQIAFLVDCHAGKVRETKFIHYLLFVTFFPHLIAGPILHHSEMMPQFADGANKRVALKHWVLGLLLFLIGALKKLLLADSVSVFVAPVFDAHGATPGLSEAWSAALAYTLQIYFDFSGYTDMALGIALLFNIKLPLNFDSPYKATSVIDFWRRWHMTLSRFLRDYLYFSLGGNRHGKVRRYLNLMITMLLGGMWHGAGWPFIIWGGLHGVYLIANHAVRASETMMSFSSRSWFVLAGRMATSLAVILAWVFFRANDFESARRVLAGMMNFSGVEPVSYLKDVQPGLLPLLGSNPWIWIAALFAIAWFAPNSQEIIAAADRLVDGKKLRLPALQKGAVFSFVISFLAALLVFAITLNVVRDAESPFIYFNF